MQIISLSIVPILGMMLSSCSPVTFPSAESRTHEGAIVYNEVSWEWGDGGDVWSMRQSHGGPHLPKKEWDELRITVKGGKTRFFQLKAGKEVPFKVSCFTCHPNGPRAIRPMGDALLSLKERAQLRLMNLRVKSYGKLVAENVPSNQLGNMPFKNEGTVIDAPLSLPACTKCHSDEGFFNRGFLKRQNSPAISFMVDNGHMPPLGGLSAEEKEFLKDFLNGF